MDKKTQLIIYLLIGISAIGFVYLAYMIDSSRIASRADIQSTKSVKELPRLPSPDESIISKLYSAIIKPFTK